MLYPNSNSQRENMKKSNSIFFNPNPNATSNRTEIDTSIKKNMPRLLEAHEIITIFAYLKNIQGNYFSSNQLMVTKNALNFHYSSVDIERILSNFNTLITNNSVLNILCTKNNISKEFLGFNTVNKDIPSTWSDWATIFMLLDESVVLMKLLIKAHKSGLISETNNKNIKIISAALIGLNVLKNQFEIGFSESMPEDTSVPGTYNILGAP